MVVVGAGGVGLVVGVVDDELVLGVVVLDEVVLDDVVLDEVVLDEVVLDEVVLDELVLDEVVVDELVGDDVVLDEVVGAVVERELEPVGTVDDELVDGSVVEPVVVGIVVELLEVVQTPGRVDKLRAGTETLAVAAGRVRVVVVVERLVRVDVGWDTPSAKRRDDGSSDLDELVAANANGVTSCGREPVSELPNRSSSALGVSRFGRCSVRAGFAPVPVPSVR